MPTDLFDEVGSLLKSKIKIDLKTKIVVTKPGDKEAAWKLIDDFAVRNGLPRLPIGQHYGLLTNGELVSAETDTQETVDRERELERKLEAKEDYEQEQRDINE